MQRPGLAQTALTVFPITNYKFGAKPAKPEKSHAAEERLARIRTKYEAEGMRRSVDAVILVGEHSHPHVLLLQVANTQVFRLPGGKLKPDEDELSGLRRKLNLYLAPESDMLRNPWDIAECVGAWVRPNFDTVLYPYSPPHITKPKELKKLFVVQLQEHAYFGVPRNYSLVAVPLFELYDNFARYGPVMGSVPAMLCRLQLNVVAPPAPEPAPGGAAGREQPREGSDAGEHQLQQQEQQQQQAIVLSRGGDAMQH